MLESIWMAISLGHRVLTTLSVLKKDVDSFRSGRAQARSRVEQLAALDKRTGALEALVQDQDDRLQELERSLQDAVTTTEAVAQRAGMIFWMALAGCGVGATALVLAAVSLSLRR